MPGANSSVYVRDFFTWLDIFFADRGLQITKCGFKNGDDLKKHVINLYNGFWDKIGYSTGKPQRWIFHVNTVGGNVLAAAPPGYESIYIGHSNTASSKKAGLVVRIVPLLTKDGVTPWRKEDSFEVVALFIFPGPAKPGHGAQPFRFDVTDGTMSYMGEVQPYVFCGLLGTQDLAASVNVNGTAVSYGDVLAALSRAIISAPVIGGAAHPPVYDLTDPAQVTALQSAVTTAFAAGQAVPTTTPTSITGPSGTVAFEDEEDEEDDEEIPPLTSVLPIPGDPNLIGIDLSVYRQINAALGSGKQHLMFYGPPGTGKTTLARWVSTKLAGSKWELLTGSADWSSQDVIGGYQSMGGDQLAFIPGILLQNFDRPFIIDELNRCDIDKVIGPLFTVLSGHRTTLPYRVDAKSKDSLQYSILPAPKSPKAEHEFAPGPGWRLIATINSIDKASLYQMSYALARRFGWVYVDAPDDLAGFIREFVGRRDGTPPPAGLCALADIWSAINAVRVIGPAPIIDTIGIVENLAPGEPLFGAVSTNMRSALLNAFDLALLPMLDGITTQDSKRIGEAVVTVLGLSGEDKRRIEARLASAAV